MRRWHSASQSTTSLPGLENPSISNLNQGVAGLVRPDNNPLVRVRAASIEVESTILLLIAEPRVASFAVTSHL